MLIRKNIYWSLFSHLHHPDAQPLLRLLHLQAQRVHGHNILRVSQKEVTNHMASHLPSFADTTRSVDFGKIYCRYVSHILNHFQLNWMDLELNWQFLLSGGNATFPNLLNNFVHICMYFYYMMSAMGPQYQKYLWWKKYMTELQIVSTYPVVGC